MDETDWCDFLHSTLLLGPKSMMNSIASGKLVYDHDFYTVRTLYKRSGFIVFLILLILICSGAMS